VIAKRLYCVDTIEKRILDRLDERRRLFSNVMDDESMSSDPLRASGLTEEELFGLFGLQVRKPSSIQRQGPVRVVLENLDPRGFENLVASVYEKEGFSVEVTGRSHDGGIDIRAERITAGGRDRIIVQCKHQKENVGRPVLQQIWGVVHSDPTLTRCDVVTSSDFTAEARGFAADKRLTLIDQAKLREMVEGYRIAEFVDPVSARPATGTKSSQPKVSVNGSGAKAPRGETKRTRLEDWPGKERLGRIRAELDASGSFRGSWEKFLDYLGLPRGKGLRNQTTVAEALKFKTKAF
jgi:hypothetical protein